MLLQWLLLLWLLRLLLLLASVLILSHPTQEVNWRQLAAVAAALFLVAVAAVDIVPTRVPEVNDRIVPPRRGVSADDAVADDCYLAANNRSPSFGPVVVVVVVVVHARSLIKATNVTNPVTDVIETTRTQKH